MHCARKPAKLFKPRCRPQSDTAHVGREPSWVRQGQGKARLESGQGCFLWQGRDLNPVTALTAGLDERAILPLNLRCWLINWRGRASLASLSSSRSQFVTTEIAASRAVRLLPLCKSERCPLQGRCSAIATRRLVVRVSRGFAMNSGD